MGYNPTPMAKPVIKRQPAPGQSPQGGTTSLPQHLATPPMANAGSAPGSPGRSPTDGSNPAPTSPWQNVPMPPAAPAPASLPPGTVPPPPPAAAPAGPTVGTPAPKEEAPGAPGGEPDPRETQMGDELFKRLMEMLENPSRYDEEGARTTGMRSLQDQQTLARDRATSDAASRGMFHSTNLSNSYGDIDDRFLQQTGDLESRIAQDKASKFQTDRMSALDAIFKYGGMQQLDQQHQDELWLRLLEAGYLDAPDINSASQGMPPVGV